MANKTLRKRVMAVALAMTSAGTMIAPMATPMVVMAAESVTDGNVQAQSEYEGITVTKKMLADAGITLSGDVVIPETIEYQGTMYTVTGLANALFYNNAEITSIQLPETIEELGSSTFKACSNLVSINIPSKIKKLDPSENDLFSGCENLTTIILSEGLESIEPYAFYCYDITNINFPSTLKNIGEEAFFMCEKLTNVVLPEGLETVGKGAFHGCTSITELNIPSSLKVIEDGAFAAMANLTKLTLNEGIESIGSTAFRYAESLTSVEIPSTVKSIGDEAFSTCIMLESVKFNEGLESIGAQAFYDMGQMIHYGEYGENGEEFVTNLGLPATLKTIGDEAFKNNNVQNFFIKDITFKGNVESIGNNAFFIFGTPIYFIDEDPLVIKASEDNAVVRNYDWSGDNRIFVFEELTTGSVTSSTEISLSNATSIGDSNSITLADAGIDTTGDVVIPETLEYQGTTYKVTSLENTFVDNTEITSVVVPDTVTSIKGAFAGCNNLKSVTLNSNVESIAEDSFQVDSEKEMTIITDQEDTAVTNYDYAADNVVATFSLRSAGSGSEGESEGDGSNNESGETNQQNDMCVTGYVTPISEMDVTISLDGFKFHIDENRDLIPTISNLENNSQFPLDVKALNIVGNIGTEPSVIAADTYTQYEWDNMNKRNTLANMALYLNGQELFEIFQNTSLDNSKAIKIGRLDSGFSGTTTMEVTPGAQYGKNFGNREEMLTFVYDLVLEFEVPEV